MGRGFGYDISEDRNGVIAGHKRAKEEKAIKDEEARVAALEAKAAQDLLKRRAYSRTKAAERRQKERDRKVQLRVKKEFDDAAANLAAIFNAGKTETGLSGENEASGMLPTIKEEQEEFDYLRNDLNDDEMVVDRRKNGIEAPPNSYVEESPLTTGAFTNGFGSSTVQKNSMFPTARPVMGSGSTIEDPFTIDFSDYFNNSASANAYANTSGGTSSYINNSTFVNTYANTNGGTNGYIKDEAMQARDEYENAAFEEAFFFTSGQASARYNNAQVSSGYL